MNYAEIDRQKIILCIDDAGGETSVENLMNNSGADKLRIYPILIKMYLSGEIVVTKEDELGAPERVRLLKIKNK